MEEEMIFNFPSKYLYPTEERDDFDIENIESEDKERIEEKVNE